MLGSPPRSLPAVARADSAVATRAAWSSADAPSSSGSWKSCNRWPSPCSWWAPRMDDSTIWASRCYARHLAERRGARRAVHRARAGTGGVRPRRRLRSALSRGAGPQAARRAGEGTRRGLGARPARSGTARGLLSPGGADGWPTASAARNGASPISSGSLMSPGSTRPNCVNWAQTRTSWRTSTRPPITHEYNNQLHDSVDSRRSASPRAARSDRRLRPRRGRTARHRHRRATDARVGRPGPAGGLRARPSTAQGPQSDCPRTGGRARRDPGRRSARSGQRLRQSLSLAEGPRQPLDARALPARSRARRAR